MNIYKCPFCGKTYTSPVAMGECAQRCGVRVAKEQANRETVLAARKEIDTAYKLLQDAISAYRKAGGEDNIQVRMTISDKNVGDGLDISLKPKQENFSFSKTEIPNKGAAFDPFAKVKNQSFESFLKDALDIKEPMLSKCKAKTPEEEELQKAIKEAEDAYNKMSPQERQLADAIMSAIADSIIREAL